MIPRMSRVRVEVQRSAESLDQRNCGFSRDSMLAWQTPHPFERADVVRLIDRESIDLFMECQEFE
jgi:hypothetical protein